MAGRRCACLEYVGTRQRDTPDKDVPMVLSLPFAARLRIIAKTLVVQCCLFVGLIILIWGLQRGYALLDRTTFPDPMPVPAEAASLDETQKGKLLIDAVTYRMRAELDSLFGWTFNDVLFNRVLLDNRAYRQYGVFHATKALMDLYSVTIAKLGSNDKESPFLYQARMNGFAIDPRSFMFPSAEGAYEKALKLVDKYKASLDDGSGSFNCRTDDIYAAFSLITGEYLLGYAIGLLEDVANEPFYTLDNPVYEVQGIVLVVRDFISTLAQLYPETVRNKNSGKDLDMAMRYLTAICTYDPLIITSTFKSGEVILADLTFAKARLEDVRSSIRM